MSELQVPVVNPAGGRYWLGLEEQLAIFDKYVEQAYNLLIDFVYEREADMKSEARERLALYYGEYGDEAFHWTQAICVKGGMEEADDLLNYLIFALYAKDKER